MIEEMIEIETSCGGDVTFFRDGTLGVYHEVHGMNGSVELDEKQTKALYDSMKEYYENTGFYRIDR